MRKTVDVSLCCGAKTVSAVCITVYWCYKRFIGGLKCLRIVALVSNPQLYPSQWRHLEFSVWD